MLLTRYPLSSRPSAADRLRGDLQRLRLTWTNVHWVRFPIASVFLGIGLAVGGEAGSDAN